MSSKNALFCRTALDGAFEKFRDLERRVQKMFPPKNTIRTNITIAPTKFGFWLVRMVDSKDQNDPGVLQVVSPEKSARVPWVNIDPDKEIHLFIRVNVFPEKISGDHPPELVCNTYRSLNFSREADRLLIDIQHYLSNQFAIQEKVNGEIRRSRNVIPLVLPKSLERNSVDRFVTDREIVSA